MSQAFLHASSFLDGFHTFSTDVSRAMDATCHSQEQVLSPGDSEQDCLRLGTVAADTDPVESFPPFANSASWNLSFAAGYAPESVAEELPWPCSADGGLYMPEFLSKLARNGSLEDLSLFADGAAWDPPSRGVLWDPSSGGAAWEPPFGETALDPQSCRQDDIFSQADVNRQTGEGCSGIHRDVEAGSGEDGSTGAWSGAPTECQQLQASLVPSTQPLGCSAEAGAQGSEGRGDRGEYSEGLEIDVDRWEQASAPPTAPPATWSSTPGEGQQLQAPLVYLTHHWASSAEAGALSSEGVVDTVTECAEMQSSPEEIRGSATAGTPPVQFPRGDGGSNGGESSAREWIGTDPEAASVAVALEEGEGQARVGVEAALGNGALASGAGPTWVQSHAELNEACCTAEQVQGTWTGGCEPCNRPELEAVSFGGRPLGVAAAQHWTPSMGDINSEGEVQHGPSAAPGCAPSMGDADGQVEAPRGASGVQPWAPSMGDMEGQRRAQHGAQPCSSRMHATQGQVEAQHGVSVAPTWAPSMGDTDGQVEDRHGASGCLGGVRPGTEHQESQTRDGSPNVAECSGEVAAEVLLGTAVTKKCPRSFSGEPSAAGVAPGRVTIGATPRAKANVAGDADVAQASTYSAQERTAAVVSTFAASTPLARGSLAARLADVITDLEQRGPPKRAATKLAASADLGRGGTDAAVQDWRKGVGGPRLDSVFARLDGGSRRLRGHLVESIDRGNREPGANGSKAAGTDSRGTNAAGQTWTKSPGPARGSVFATLDGDSEEQQVGHNRSKDSGDREQGSARSPAADNGDPSDLQENEAHLDMNCARAASALHGPLQQVKLVHKSHAVRLQKSANANEQALNSTTPTLLLFCDSGETSTGSEEASEDASYALVHARGDVWAMNSASLGKVSRRRKNQSTTHPGLVADVSRKLTSAESSGDESECIYGAGPLCLHRIFPSSQGLWRTAGVPGPAKQRRVVRMQRLQYAVTGHPMKGPCPYGADSPPPPPAVHPGMAKKVRSQLMALAEAYATDQPMKVRFLMQKLKEVSSPDGNNAQKLAHYMTTALHARCTGIAMPSAVLDKAVQLESPTAVHQVLTRVGWFVLSEICNTSAVIRHLRGHPRVHIIMLNDSTGIFWPAVLSALAQSCPGGAPQLCVTAINFRFSPDYQPTNPQGLSPAEALQQEAAKHGIPLALRHIHVAYDQFHPHLVPVHPDEAVAVLSSWSLMVFPDDTLLKSNPRNTMLKWVHSLQPKVFVLMEGDADFNTPFFLRRCEETMTRGWLVLEAFDATFPHGAPGRRAFELILAQDLMNSVACEGLSRFARSERLEQWIERMSSMGFSSMEFEEDMWEDIRQLEMVDPRLTITKENKVARYKWRGVPILFASAWVPR